MRERNGRICVVVDRISQKNRRICVVVDRISENNRRICVHFVQAGYPSAPGH